MDILPIVILAALPLGLLFFRYKTKTKRYDMLIKIAELGREIDPELLESLGDKPKSYKDDYRSALIWAACGIPVLIGGSIEEAKLSSTILFSLPLCVGFSLFLSGKMRLRESEK